MPARTTDDATARGGWQLAGVQERVASAAVGRALSGHRCAAVVRCPRDYRDRARCRKSFGLEARVMYRSDGFWCEPELPPVFPGCHWNCHSPLLLFVHVILQRLSSHALPLAAWLMSRRPRSQDGGTKVWAGKHGGRDRSFQPLAVVLKKFACLELFLYHYYSSRVLLSPRTSWV